MPSKKKKYNARFPAGRIKKIMQTDEEVGKVAQAVPIIISRTLELFVESLLTKAMQITSAKNAKTLSPSHMKQCILSESRFDFLKDLVKTLPDVTSCDSEDGVTHTNTTPQTCLNLVKSEASSVSSRRQPEFFAAVKEEKEPVVQPPQTTTTAMSTRMAPNFYRERSESNVSSSAGYGHYSPTPSLPVSQTSAQPSAIRLEINDDSDGGDEDKEESASTFVGQDPVSTSQNIMRPQVNSAVDEDYDT